MKQVSKVIKLSLYNYSCHVVAECMLNPHGTAEESMGQQANSTEKMA